MLVDKPIQAGRRPRDACCALPGGHPCAVCPPRAATSAPPPRWHRSERREAWHADAAERGARMESKQRGGRRARDPQMTRLQRLFPAPPPTPCLADSASASGCRHSPGRGGAPRDDGFVASSGGVWWRGSRISAGGRCRAIRERAGGWGGSRAINSTWAIVAETQGTTRETGRLVGLRKTR